VQGAVEEKRYRTVRGTVQRKDSSSTPPPALPGVITATTPCPSLEQLSTVVAKVIPPGPRRSCSACWAAQACSAPQLYRGLVHEDSATPVLLTYPPSCLPRSPPLQRGDGTLYINDHIALHSVGCAPGSEAPTITLHLYAPPIQRVQLFEPDTNRVVERKPGFFSVRGRRV
jgi:hypothetical protein